MKVRARTTASSPPRSAIGRYFEGARAPKSSRAPSAEFTPVPKARQAKVAAGVRAAVAQRLDGRVAAERQAAVKALLAHVGQGDFYDVLADQDPGDAGHWHQMATVQRQFAAQEAGFDPKTRAYSESMRLTLHASVIEHFAFPQSNGGQSLYNRFIALHLTAFHQNGGWVDNLQIPVSGALAVAEATPAEMWGHSLGLLGGAFITDAPTVAAAQLVRLARRAALD